MPRIEMTRTVRIALFALRVYLIVLLGLIILSFVMTFSGPKKDARPDNGAEPSAPSAASHSIKPRPSVAPLGAGNPAPLRQARPPVAAL